MVEVTDKVRILLIDDHPLIRESLTNLINQQSNMHVCGEAEGAQRGMEVVAASKPDVIIMDLSLNDGSGLDLLRAMNSTHPEVRIIVLSMHDEKLYAERCLRSGARGYVMKSESTKRIVTAIRDVLLGRLAISDPIASVFAEKLMGARRSPASSPLEVLSNRELEVFNLLGQGMGTRQIAKSLNVSMKTVQAYCARIKTKMGLASGAELLRQATLWHEQVNDSV
jgi:DNA-binding NarL/FixJ family response regulator